MLSWISRPATTATCGWVSLPEVHRVPKAANKEQPYTVKDASHCWPPDHITFFPLVCGGQVRPQRNVCGCQRMVVMEMVIS